MAALFGLGIDNAYIEIDGPEVPILDGSSDLFVELIEKTGTRAQAAPRKIIEVLQPIEAVSYTHLDVYKRQMLLQPNWELQLQMFTE